MQQEIRQLGENLHFIKSVYRARRTKPFLSEWVGPPDWPTAISLTQETAMTILLSNRAGLLLYRIKTLHNNKNATER
jgi:hypothetical protein